GRGRYKRYTTVLLLHKTGLGRTLQIRSGARRRDPRSLHMTLRCDEALSAEVATVIMSRRHQVEPSPFQVISNLRIRQHERTDALTTRGPLELFKVCKVHFQVAIGHVSILHEVPHLEEFWLVVHRERAT